MRKLAHAHPTNTSSTALMVHARSVPRIVASLIAPHRLLYNALTIRVRPHSRNVHVPRGLFDAQTHRWSATRILSCALLHTPSAPFTSPFVAPTGPALLPAGRALTRMAARRTTSCARTSPRHRHTQRASVGPRRASTGTTARLRRRSCARRASA